MARVNLPITMAVLVTLMGISDNRTGLTQTSSKPMNTRDSATLSIGGSIPDPSVAMLVGVQVGGGGTFSGPTLRVRPIVGCDNHFAKEFSKPGEYPVAGAGLVHVCSYSISNGSIAQDVQFLSGTPVSSGGGGDVCSVSSGQVGGPITSRFHLAPNQFISQGIGVGSLFWTDVNSRALCFKIFGKGDVSVNITYSILR